MIFFINESQSQNLLHEDIISPADGIYYHGTSSTKKEIILTSGFKLFQKKAVYVSSNPEIAMSYGYNRPENLIKVDISGLNIKWLERPPRTFFDLSDADIRPYIDGGFDEVGISNKSEVAIFNPNSIKIV